MNWALPSAPDMGGPWPGRIICVLVAVWLLYWLGKPRRRR